MCEGVGKICYTDLRLVSRCQYHFVEKGNAKKDATFLILKSYCFHIFQ